MFSLRIQTLVMSISPPAGDKPTHRPNLTFKLSHMAYTRNQISKIKAIKTLQLFTIICLSCFLFSMNVCFKLGYFFLPSRKRLNYVEWKYFMKCVFALISC